MREYPIRFRVWRLNHSAITAPAEGANYKQSIQSFPFCFFSEPQLSHLHAFQALEMNGTQERSTTTPNLQNFKQQLRICNDYETICLSAQHSPLGFYRLRNSEFEKKKYFFLEVPLHTNWFWRITSYLPSQQAVLYVITYKFHITISIITRIITTTTTKTTVTRPTKTATTAKPATVHSKMANYWGCGISRFRRSKFLLSKIAYCRLY